MTSMPSEPAKTNIAARLAPCPGLERQRDLKSFQTAASSILDVEPDSLPQ